MKRLTDILKRQPKGSTYNLGEKGGFQPPLGQTAKERFLAKHTVHDHGEPFEIDHLGGVKQFDRGANRFGHDNVEYNKVSNKGELQVATIPTEEVDEEDMEILGELMDAYFEENPEASFEQAYSAILEDLMTLEEGKGSYKNYKKTTRPNGSKGWTRKKTAPPMNDRNK